TAHAAICVADRAGRWRATQSDVGGTAPLPGRHRSGRAGRVPFGTATHRSPGHRGITIGHRAAKVPPREPEIMDRRMTWAKRFAVITAVGMFIVLLMGANVTATDS